MESGVVSGRSQKQQTLATTGTSSAWERGIWTQAPRFPLACHTSKEAGAGIDILVCQEKDCYGEPRPHNLCKVLIIFVKFVPVDLPVNLS